MTSRDSRLQRLHDCSLKTQLNTESPVTLWVKELCACRTSFKETVLLRRHKITCIKMVNEFCCKNAFLQQNAFLHLTWNTCKWNWSIIRDSRSNAFFEFWRQAQWRHFPVSRNFSNRKKLIVFWLYIRVSGVGREYLSFLIRTRRSSGPEEALLIARKTSDSLAMTSHIHFSSSTRNGKLEMGSLSVKQKRTSREILLLLKSNKTEISYFNIGLTDWLSFFANCNELRNQEQ